MMQTFLPKLNNEIMNKRSNQIITRMSLSKEWKKFTSNDHESITYINWDEAKLMMYKEVMLAYMYMDTLLIQWWM